MSYILDALRRADAERERGHVPSIHAQTGLPNAAPAAAGRTPRVGLWIGGGALLLVAAVGATWWLAGGMQRAATPVIAATAPPTAVATAPAPAPASLPATRAESPAVPAPAASGPAAAARPRPKPAAAPATAKTAGTSPDAATTGSGPHAGKIYAISELPDEIRRQLPAVNVGGSMYSPVKSDRILIVNGQVLHEGDKITPELVLEQVRVKSAVLAFRGYRYSIAF